PRTTHRCCGNALRTKAHLQGGMRSDATIRFAGLAGRPNSGMAPAPRAFCHHLRSERPSGRICHGRWNRRVRAAVAALRTEVLSPDEPRSLRGGSRGRWSETGKHLEETHA